MDSEEKLLKEYGLAQEYISSLYGQTWQVGAILIAASLGAFAIILSIGSVSAFSLEISVGCGIGSTALLVIWNLIRNRHHSFNQVSYYRMQEIETELGLWRNRYIHYLDNPLDSQFADLSEDEKDRLRKLEVAFAGKWSKIKITRLSSLLTLLIPLMWLSWVVYQVIVLVV